MKNNNFHKWFQKFAQDNKLNKDETEKIQFLQYSDYSEYKKLENTFTIFEDWWVKNPEIVKSKIISIFSKTKRIYARKCKIQTIKTKQTRDFLNKHHIYGATISKHQLGLFYKEELVALSTFAGQRAFSKGRSAEMLRFCNKSYTTTIGGLSKLIKEYTKRYKPDDIMTYADLDWGYGKAFLQMGFKNMGIRKPIKFYCRKSDGERIPKKLFKDELNKKLYEEIENSGSTKLVLNINISNNQ